jgi:hypothetical protein
MGIYRSEEQLFNVMGTAWERAFADATVRERFVGLQIFVQFRLHEPEAELWLLSDGTVHRGTWSGTADKPIVLMEMKSDVAHRFWRDELNVPLATAKGEIKAKGPVTKIFGLLPIVKPVKALYPGLCAEHRVGEA